MVQGIPIDEAIKRWGVEILLRLEKIEDLPEGHPARITPPYLRPGVYKINPEMDSDSKSITLVAEPGQVTVAAAVDAVIAEWEVGTKATGEVIEGYLRFISFDSNNPGKAEWTIIIGGITLFSTQTLQNGINLDFSDMNGGKGFRLHVGQVVQVIARTDGTSVVHDAMIEGQEEA